MAHLYTDENFPQDTVEELARLGHDVLTSHEVGNSGLSIPDDEVLKFAIKSNRVLVTLNRRHFIRLHIINPSHKGIIVCTFNPDYITLAHRIHAALEAQPEMIGQLVRVYRPNQ
jgi:hypothetical protein